MLLAALGFVMALSMPVRGEDVPDRRALDDACLDLLEPSYVLVGPKSQILEAQIAPHIRALGFRLWAGPHVRISVTPMIRLRIFREESAPVRTPSFLPKLNVQMLWERGSTDAGGPRSWRGITLVVGHHSNGQAGCTYASSPDGGSCQPPDDPEELRLNTRDGSFSTNFLQISGAFRHAQTTGSGAERSHTVAVTFETHPKWLSIGDAGVLEGPLRPVYGVNRLRANYSLKQRYGGGLAGQVRLGFALDYILKTADGADCRGGGCADRTGIAIDLGYLFKNPRNWGPFLRFHEGQDYYNIAFPHKLQRLQGGVSYSAFNF